MSGKDTCYECMRNETINQIIIASLLSLHEVCLCQLDTDQPIWGLLFIITLTAQLASKRQAQSLENTLHDLRTTFLIGQLKKSIIFCIIIIF